MKKKICIINGHPDSKSLCNSLAESYKKGAENSGAECVLYYLGELKFNPILSKGYREQAELEPDLLKVQKDISESDHLVFVYPTWWGTYPALLKGFIDRVFLPGFAFSYKENSRGWHKLLKGKSARIIVTMDSPKWYYKLVYRSPGHNSMKTGVLQFCGINPVSITTLSPIKSSDESKRKQWLAKIEKLGNQQK